MFNYSVPQKIFMFINYLLYTATFIYALISLAFFNSLSLIFQSIIAILLLTIPSIVNKFSSINLKFGFVISYYFIIFLTLFLGFILKFYQIYPWYDIVTHSLSHLFLVLLGAIFINYSLKQKQKVNKYLIAFLSLLFALAFGFLWELVEFSLDSFFGLNMQRFIPDATNLYNGGNSFANLNGTDNEIATFFKVPSGYKYALLDTMYDLVVDLIGAIVGTIIFLTIKNKYKFYQTISKKVTYN